MNVWIKVSPAANIRRLAAVGLDAGDIVKLTGYQKAEVARALAAKRPMKK